MIFGTTLRWGLPLSFVYCTIWQQNIWREVDEKLIAEQKHTWKTFFGLVDCGYSMVMNKLNLNQDNSHPPKRLNLATKIESMDFAQCWNAKVMNFFSIVDQATYSKSMGRLTKSLGLSK